MAKRAITASDAQVASSLRAALGARLVSFNLGALPLNRQMQLVSESAAIISPFGQARQRRISSRYLASAPDISLPGGLSTE